MAAAVARSSRQKPQTLRVRDNLPLEKRARVNIQPKDPEFIETEKYFAKLLADESFTIDRILKDHFTPHEIDKFIPTNRDPMATWQREDAVCYNELLKTRFKGGTPTLAFKIAMLYYGLPAAPMKMMVSQVVDTSDFADLEEDRIFTSDPLSFLDEQGKRTYEDEPSTADKPIYGPPTIQPLNLSLRGGGLDDNDVELVLSNTDDESSEHWERQANDQLALSLRGGADRLDVSHQKREFYTMYGREGSIQCGFDRDELIASICTLLRVSDADAEVEVVVDLFQRESQVNSPDKLVYLNSVQGSIYPTLEREDENEESIVVQHLEHHMTVETMKDGRVAFVRLPSDDRPTTPEPALRQDGLVRLFYHDGSREAVAYMRTPSRPTKFHSPTQYVSEYTRAVNGLLSPSAHNFVAIQDAENGDYYVNLPLYCRQDPPTLFIIAIAEAFAYKTQPTFSLNLETQTATGESISPVRIPIVLPVETDTMARDELSPLMLGKGDIATADALSRVVENVSKSISEPEFSPASLQVWVPAESFQVDSGPHPSRESVIIPLNNDGEATKAGVRTWIGAIERLERDAPVLYERGFAVVVRPVHECYQFRAASDPGKSIDFLSPAIGLDQFKNKVARELYPGKYKPNDNSLVLLVWQHSEEIPQAIKFDTTELEWTRYLQRITESVVNVELLTGPESARMRRHTTWDVDSRSYWGPCYDEQGSGQLKTTETSPARPSPSQPRRAKTNSKSKQPPPPPPKQRPGPTPGSSQPNTPAHVPKPIPTLRKNRSYGRNNSGMPGPMSDPEMRHQTYWDAPSIFSNRLKPVMPIHAPPIETIIKTGPVVPGSTVGVRTGTEGAALQGQVHLLRGQLLDRVRECPYADCDKYFHYRDEDELDEHLKKDHAVVQCSLCLALNKTTKDGEIPLLENNSAKILHHFYTEHSTQLREICGSNGKFDTALVYKIAATKKPARPKIGNQRFCDRCGRNNSDCHDAEDHLHHEKHCRPHVQKSNHCAGCGTPRAPLCACPNKKCVSHRADVQAANSEDHCQKCGMDLGGYSLKYRTSHMAGCQYVGGRDHDYCSHCGTSLVGLASAQITEHQSVCNLSFGDHEKTLGKDGTGDLDNIAEEEEELIQKEVPVRSKHGGPKALRVNRNGTFGTGRYFPRHPKACLARDGDFQPGSSDDEEDDVVMTDEGVEGPGSSKKRKRHSSTDPTYFNGRRVDPEPEEEVSTMGAPEEDYSVLTPGAKEIPPDFPSPIKETHGKKRARKGTPKKAAESPTKADEVEPKPKRVKIAGRGGSAPPPRGAGQGKGKGKEIAPAGAGQDPSATADEVEEIQGVKAKPKTKPTPKKPAARAKTPTPASAANAEVEEEKREEAEKSNAKTRPTPKKPAAKATATTPAPATKAAPGEEGEKPKPKTKATPGPKAKKSGPAHPVAENAAGPSTPAPSASSTLAAPTTGTRTSARVKKLHTNVVRPSYAESTASETGSSVIVTPTEVGPEPKTPKTGGRKKAAAKDAGAAEAKMKKIEEEKEGPEPDPKEQPAQRGRPKKKNTGSSIKSNKGEVTDEFALALAAELGIDLNAPF